jgi:proline iminopeptidase
VLYPPLEPHAQGLLPAEGGHQIYWEVCGNPKGEPALFLHGGPGGGCSTDNRRLFDPARYRVVLFDQRGCGRSRPLGGLSDNTTGHLLADIEALRRMLEIERWLVLGGSWGAALALAYAQTWPERVRALVLRGVFTARPAELNWLYQGGAAMLFPEAWEAFCAPIPPEERTDMIGAYFLRLTCGSPELERDAARAWCAWEHAVMTLLPQAAATGRDDAALRALARLEAHYFVHHAFFSEDQLLRDAGRLAGIPGTMVQGRYDAVTPAATAWALHRAWPGSRLVMVPDAGHASSEPGIQRALVEATDFYAAPGDGQAAR